MDELASECPCEGERRVRRHGKTTYDGQIDGGGRLTRQLDGKIGGTERS